MKRLTLLVIVCVLLTTPYAAGTDIDTSTASSYHYRYDSPAITTTLSQQIPYPAHPGEELTLIIKTTNCGGESAMNLIWHLNAKEPFELKEVSEATQTLPELWVGETTNTEYYLTVDPDARSGEYIIELNITYCGDFDNKYLTTKSMVEITVVVQGAPDLVLIDSDIPETSPKSEFDAKFSIKNVGTGPAKNVKVSFENQTGILPKTSTRYVETIAPGETAVVESGFFVDATTPSQYPLTVAIRYENETHGTEPTQSYSVLVPVIGENALFIYLDSQDDLMSRAVGEITIGIANRGLARAKHISLTIAESDGAGSGDEHDGFRLIGTGTCYIGDIESDDYDTADFTILPQQEGCCNVTVDVSYADDYGSKYSMTTDVPIKVYSSQEMKEIAPGGGGYTWMIIGALILLLAFVFRKRIKRIISR